MGPAPEEKKMENKKVVIKMGFYGEAIKGIKKALRKGKRIILVGSKIWVKSPMGESEKGDYIDNIFNGDEYNYISYDDILGTLAQLILKNDIKKINDIVIYTSSDQNGHLENAGLAIYYLKLDILKYGEIVRKGIILAATVGEKNNNPYFKKWLY